MECARVARVKASNAHLPKTCKSSQVVVRNMWQGLYSRRRVSREGICASDCRRPCGENASDKRRREEIKHQRRKKKAAAAAHHLSARREGECRSLSRCSLSSSLVVVVCVRPLPRRSISRMDSMPVDESTLPSSSTTTTTSSSDSGVSKYAMLQSPAAVLLALASFGVEPCCTQRHCCYDYSVASIVLVRKLLPHNERGRTEAVARMLRTMRQHDGKFRLVDPLDSSRRVCQPWFCFLLGICRRKLSNAKDMIHSNLTYSPEMDLGMYERARSRPSRAS